MVFAGDHYYSCGGWNDFKESFDTLIEAKQCAQNLATDWVHIIDADSGKEVYQFMNRSLNEIALEVWKDWKEPYFGAVPYLSAMESLESINDNYYEDTARSVVAYFLANADTWRGETARRVKKELNEMLKLV